MRNDIEFESHPGDILKQPKTHPKNRTFRGELLLELSYEPNCSENITETGDRNPPARRPEKSRGTFSVKSISRKSVRFRSFRTSKLRNDSNIPINLCNSAAILRMENEISKINSRITYHRQSRRRHSCPNDLNFECQEPSKIFQSENDDQMMVIGEEDVMNDDKVWNRSEEMACRILCIFLVAVGISLLIIILLYWPSAR